MTALRETPLVEPPADEPTAHPRGTPPHPTSSVRELHSRPVARPPGARQRAVYRRRRIGAAVVALALLTLAVLGVQAATSLISRVAAPAEAAPAAPLAMADGPVQLSMPAAGITMPLSGGGVDGRGLIDPPPGEAIWFTGHDRVAPGQVGTSVVAGRATGDGGEPTPFAQITSLNEGDRLVLTFDDGVTLELDVVTTALVERRDLEASDVLWGDQAETRRVALVTSDEVTDADGNSRGSFLAVAELD